MKFWQRAKDAGLELPKMDPTLLADRFEGTQCLKLNGKALAANILKMCAEYGKTHRLQPKLVVILAGEDPASRVYVGNKAKMFLEAGFLSETIAVPSAECSFDKIASLISRLNNDSTVHGILVQLPLPKGLDERGLLSLIRPSKDVDGILSETIGHLATGSYEAPTACTPFGMMVLLEAYGIPVAGKRAVVVGRSNTVGKPMSLLLLGEDATVTMAHSRTQNLVQICKEADILVAAVGRPGIITKEHVKPGAVVLDVGINRNADGKLCGDVAADVKEVAAALTPVPGGVGPMTVAMLLLNTLLAAQPISR